MKNKNSKVGHVPKRKCVICKNISDKNGLIRFMVLEKEIVFDIAQNLSGRGFYVCDSNNCLQKLKKWKKKKVRKINEKKKK